MNKDIFTNKTNAISKVTGVPFNTVMVYFFMECILKKIVKTDMADKLIFKGGFLLSSTLGISNRATVDIDMLVSGTSLTEDLITNIVMQICESEEMAEVSCELTGLEKIRIEDKYGGYRAKILCRLENIRQIVPLDFATGDPVTPSPILFTYKCLFSNESIPVFGYNPETILAEKLETIFNRGIANSRSKDFFDIYILWVFKRESIDADILEKAMKNTFQYRGSEWNPILIEIVLKEVMNDPNMNRRWGAWQKRNIFAKGIAFSQTVDAGIEIINTLNIDDYQD